ncbi:MAG: flagellar FliJ family protein [Oligoflexales bacterium]|nr:flagellar FliJ family protein [Oligoflexales bacterium]
MNETKNKIKRINPLIKAKNIELMTELSQLAKIKMTQKNAEQELQENQKNYLHGIEKLNQLRSTSRRENLEIFEGTLNFLKENWKATYIKLKELEFEVQKQTERVTTAHTKLKSLEQVHEKLEVDHKREKSKQEQKKLDEIAGRKSFET